MVNDIEILMEFDDTHPVETIDALLGNLRQTGALKDLFDVSYLFRETLTLLDCVAKKQLLIDTPSDRSMTYGAPSIPAMKVLDGLDLPVDLIVHKSSTNKLVRIFTEVGDAKMVTWAPLKR